MTAPRKFAHIVYRTHHMDDMIEWYTYVLECKVQHRGEQLAFLTYDDEHHRVAFLNLGPAPDGKTGMEAQGPSLARKGAGVHHVAYTWDTLGELMDVYKRLKSRNITPVTCVLHGLTFSMYYADPDGNGMEFQVDVLSLKDAADFMHGPAFAANPIGDMFDPEKILADIAAGKPIEALVLRKDQTMPADGLMVALA